MSFVQRELDKINAEIVKGVAPNRRDELYAAQQALSWALDPTGAKAPYNMIMGIEKDPVPSYGVLGGPTASMSDPH